MMRPCYSQHRTSRLAVPHTNGLPRTVFLLYVSCTASFTVHRVPPRAKNPNLLPTTNVDATAEECELLAPRTTLQQYTRTPDSWVDGLGFFHRTYGTHDFCSFRSSHSFFVVFASLSTFSHTHMVAHSQPDFLITVLVFRGLHFLTKRGIFPLYLRKAHTNHKRERLHSNLCSPARGSEDEKCRSVP